MTDLRVLIACEQLEARGGIEMYTRDVAYGLLRAGHTPIIFTNRPGAVAEEIRKLTIPVVNRLDAIAVKPDLIYGQQHLQTMMALLHFTDVPAAYVCHDWYGQNSAAPRFPRILRFVAVDVTCRDRLICEDGIEESRVRLLPNSVDLNRFARRSPLPARPARALVFGNYTEDNAHLAALRAACTRRGIELDAIGERMNNSAARPEELLANYDVVFAKGRAALEALAVGAAVVIYSGVRYLGPMVTAAEVERLLPLNFGVRAMSEPLEPDELSRRVERELGRYDPADAAEVTRIVRRTAGHAAAMHAIIEVCEETIAEYGRVKADLDACEEGRAAAAYLERLRAQHWDTQNSSTAKLSRKLDRYPRFVKLTRSVARAIAR